MLIHFIRSILEVDGDAWNQLCPNDYPFVRHQFLAALETSQSTHQNTGWQPEHLLVYNNDQLIAAMPGYVKTHSYGEYVFDWSWADAYQRAGYAYYPKWINAIPFTPSVGPRVLCQPAHLTTELIHHITQALEHHCREKYYSGWHCLFPTHALSKQLNTPTILQRLGCQFHWLNRNYNNFDHFLAQMTSRKRKNISKERRQVIEQGFTFEVKTGTNISTEDFDFFYRLYCNTYLKRSGHGGYLTAAFFRQLYANDQVILIIAQKETAEKTLSPVAASLFFRDQTTLYGRYWGCLEEYQFLHFETCYYQGIDYAITNKLEHFDGGAQGEHKIARGFEPVLTYSNHWIANTQFSEAIENFLTQETAAIQHYATEAQSLLPFKVVDENEQGIT